MRRSDELADIAERLKGLPTGRVENRRRGLFSRPYHTWEGPDGQEHGRFLSRSESAEVSERLRERERLLARMAALQAHESMLRGLRTSVATGERLVARCAAAHALRERWCMGDLLGYLGGGAAPAPVCAIYGLRRTGKTVMMMQAAWRMEEAHPDSTAYMTIGEGDSMQDVMRDLLALSAAGYQYAFVDGVTLAEGFVDESSQLANVIAADGMKVVLTGTDSLSLALAARDGLFDRMVPIRTTRIPYEEFAYLTGYEDIDDYIRHGGTLSLGDAPYESWEFVNWGTASHYVDTAIADNIQHSLDACRGGDRYEHLRELRERGMLTSVIDRYVQGMNREYTLRAARGAFRLSDWGSLGRQLGSREDMAAFEGYLQVDKQDLAKLVEEALLLGRDAAWRPQDLTEAQIAELDRWLQDLDVTTMVRELRIGGVDRQKYVFVQPGLRYAFATETADALRRARGAAGVSEAQREQLARALMATVEGHILEDVVMGETLDSLLPGEDAAKVTGHLADGRQFEFDIAIMDRSSGTCRLYEVKLSEGRHEGQARHLEDPEALALASERLGRIVERAVIYRGDDVPSDRPDGISYVSVRTYLHRVRTRTSASQAISRKGPVVAGPRAEADPSHGQRRGASPAL